MTGGIFISYRRDDSRHAAGRLVDRLGQTFGRDQLFMDVDAIEPGLDFVQVLGEKIDSCDVLLALIGPGWLDATDQSGRRRLDNPSDFVRLEIETALRRNIRVIPVLLDDADLPSEEGLPPGLKSLARRQAVSIAHERFATDADGLVRSLARVVEPNRASTMRAPRAPRSAPVPARTGLSHRLIAWAYALLALPASIALGFVLWPPLQMPFAALVGSTMIAVRSASVGVRVAWVVVYLLPALLVAAIGAYLSRSRGAVIATSELTLYWIGGTFTLACHSFLSVWSLGRTPDAGVGSGLLVAAAVGLAGCVLLIVDLRRVERARDAANPSRDDLK